MCEFSFPFRSSIFPYQAVTIVPVVAIQNGNELFADKRERQRKDLIYADRMHAYVLASQVHGQNHHFSTMQVPQVTPFRAHCIVVIQRNKY